MKKAYVNGEEIIILQYGLTGYIPTCKVKINETGWIIEVPTAFIDIR